VSARDRMLATIVAVAVCTAAGWFLVLAPQREEADQLAADIAAQQAALSTALTEVAAGEAAKRDYPRHYATVARLGAAVPEDDNVPSLLVQIERAASDAGVDFRALKAGGGTAVPPPPPPADGTAATTQTTTATLPPGAAVGAAGFPTMPFTFTFTGDFFRLSDFLGRLEHFLVVRDRTLAVHGRFMAVDGIALNAAGSGFPRIQASVAATTYLLPAAEGLTNGATPSGPAGAGSDGSATGQTAGKGLPATTATVTGARP
jgi:hypothetical protein